MTAIPPSVPLCHGCSVELPWDEDAEAYEGLGITCGNCGQEVRICLSCDIDGAPGGFPMECPYAMDERECPEDAADRAAMNAELHDPDWIAERSSEAGWTI